MSTVYNKLLNAQRDNGGGLLLLLDPDRGDLRAATPLIEAADDAGVTALLVGTSFLFAADFHKAVAEIKALTTLPVILFPGASTQVAPDADAILFMSLLSGRNPQYLIEEQVRGAPQVKASGIEPIPTGYLLIESASYTSVEYVSNTRPIPRTKSDLAAAHALAAQYLGMKLVYLEAGSGARLSAPREMIETVVGAVDIPVVVGGGIVTPDEAAQKIQAGASFVVVGTRFEAPGSISALEEFAQACRTQAVTK